MKKILLIIFVPIIAHGQKSETKAVLDTIPTIMSIYRTDSATSILRVVRGFEVYEDSVLAETVPGYTITGKDTTFTIWEYLTEAWLVDYLDVNKKPIDAPIAVWESKPERLTDMHPPIGL